MIKENSIIDDFFSWTKEKFWAKFSKSQFGKLPIYDVESTNTFAKILSQSEQNLSKNLEISRMCTKLGVDNSSKETKVRKSF